MKTSGLIGENLDYWAAKANGKKDVYIRRGECWVSVDPGIGAKYSPSTDWSQGGPILELSKMCFYYEGGGEYSAYIHPMGKSQGKSMLIAAMRCIVASKYGDEVPDE